MSPINVTLVAVPETLRHVSTSLAVLVLNSAHPRTGSRKGHSALADPPPPSLPLPINEANDVVLGRHHRQMAFRGRVAAPSNEINLVLIGFGPAAARRTAAECDTDCRDNSALTATAWLTAPATD